jgi:HAD superfamily hydrolase (TIGR01509 family)
LQQVEVNLRAAGFDAAADFDALVSADRFERLKPAPDVFLAAAREVGIAPENCVVVEDAPAGVQAARAAGVMLACLLLPEPVGANP